jgi:hypothetical protein
VLLGWRVVAHRHSIWPDFFAQAYLLTAGVFGVLMLGHYPDFGARWFWRSMIPIFTMPTGVIAGLFAVTVQTASLDPKLPARMVYSLIGGACVIEWRICLFIIDYFHRK